MLDPSAVFWRILLMIAVWWRSQSQGEVNRSKYDIFTPPSCYSSPLHGEGRSCLFNGIIMRKHDVTCCQLGSLRSCVHHDKDLIWIHLNLLTSTCSGIYKLWVCCSETHHAGRQRFLTTHRKHCPRHRHRWQHLIRITTPLWCRCLLSVCTLSNLLHSFIRFLIAIIPVGAFMLTNDLHHKSNTPERRYKHTELWNRTDGHLSQMAKLQSGDNSGGLILYFDPRWLLLRS